MISNPLNRAAMELGTTRERLLLLIWGAFLLRLFRHDDIFIYGTCSQETPLLRLRRSMLYNTLGELLRGDPHVSPRFMGKSDFGYVFCRSAEGVSKLVFRDLPGELSLAAIATEQDLSFQLVCLSSRYSDTTLRAWTGCLELFVQELAVGPERILSNVVLLTCEEHNFVLGQANGTSKAYPMEIPVHKLIAAQGRRTPDATALLFRDERVSYGTLNERSDSLAAVLLDAGVDRGSIVGIYAERSICLVVSILGILKAGAAYLPLDPDYPRKRLDCMLRDSKVPLVLVQRELQSRLGDIDARSLIIDDHGGGDAHLSAGRCLDGVPSGDIAYVMYTSGSTGSPKGVISTHPGLANRLHWMQDCFRLDCDDVVVLKTPVSFDVSVWELLWPLMAGAKMAIAEPGAHRDPACLIELFTSRSVTTAHFVPSMLNAFLEEQDAKRCTTLKRVICSGEALSPRLQEALFSRLNCELFNLYGPTEASIDVTAWQCRSERTQSSIPIGYPIANTRIFVLDENLRLLPRESVGEICIAGIGLAKGYVGLPTLTQERFPSLSLEDAKPTRIYRTGDLGRLGDDGAFQYVGRLDAQVKIRGVRIEVGEIEHALSKYPGILESAVVAVVKEESKTLVAYLRVPDAIPSPLQNMQASHKLRAFLETQLPAYMIPEYLVFVTDLPLTPSGKTDRAALAERGVPAQVADARFDDAPSPAEAELLSIWREVFELPTLGVADDFFHLGGNSLHAVRIASRIRKHLHRSVSVQTVFKARTVQALSLCLESPVEPDPMVELSDDCLPDKMVPLSLTQESLWLWTQLEPESRAYHIQYAVCMGGTILPEQVSEVLTGMISHHECLRSRFAICDEVPLCSFTLPERVPVHCERIDGESFDERMRKAMERVTALSQEPFALAERSLYRFGLLDVGRERSIFAAIFHHIIFDEWSWHLFLKDFIKRLEAIMLGTTQPSSDVDHKYSHFARQQQCFLRSEEFSRKLHFWIGHFSDLPESNERHPQQNAVEQGPTQALACKFTLSPELSDHIVAFCRDHGITPFILVMAAFGAVVMKDKELLDEIISFPVAGRLRPEFEQAIGFFSNLLVPRIRLRRSESFANGLERVRVAILTALQHQEVPFDKIVRSIRPARQQGKVLLLKYACVLRDVAPVPVSSAIPDIEPLELDELEAKFDLKLDIQVARTHFHGKFVYRASAFGEREISQYVRTFQAVLANGMADEQQPLSQAMIGPTLPHEALCSAQTMLETGLSAPPLPEAFRPSRPQAPE